MEILSEYTEDHSLDSVYSLLNNRMAANNLSNIIT